METEKILLQLQQENKGLQRIIKALNRVIKEQNKRMAAREIRKINFQKQYL